ASRLLPVIAPGVAPAVSVRQAAGSLRLVPVGVDSVEAGTASEVDALLLREGSVGVIAADSRVSALSKALRRKGIDAHVLGSDDELTRLTIVPASLAKGLEFDAVVVVEPAEIVAAESRGLRRLYVVLTRAVSELVVVHAESLPAELAG
ncbi:MAG: ATP-binding domain-containing protein, partial [Actinomycetota bacterium]